jgi:hypothetical protein
MSDKQNYFDYVENVLGVKSLLADLTKESTFHHTPILITIENYEQYSEAETDLLSKMISALKIDINKIKIVDNRNSKNFTADFYVHFVDVKPNFAKTEDKLVITHSPKFLLQNSEFKKIAWNDLQKVITYFSK